MGGAGEATNRLSAGCEEHHCRNCEADHVHHIADSHYACMALGMMSAVWRECFVSVPRTKVGM